jgi:hypothetical protein
VTWASQLYLQVWQHLRLKHYTRFHLTLPTVTTIAPSPRHRSISPSIISAIVSSVAFCSLSAGLLLFFWFRHRHRRLARKTSSSDFEHLETKDTLFHESGQVVLALDATQRPEAENEVRDIQGGQWDKLTRERNAVRQALSSIFEGGVASSSTLDVGSSAREEALRAQLAVLQSKLDAALSQGSELPPPAYVPSGVVEEHSQTSVLDGSHSEKVLLRTWFLRTGD